MADTPAARLEQRLREICAIMNKLEGWRYIAHQVRRDVNALFRELGLPQLKE